MYSEQSASHIFRVLKDFVLILIMSLLGQRSLNFEHSKVVVCLSVSLKMKPLIWSKGTDVSKCTLLVTFYCICILRQYLFYTQDLSVRFYTLRHIFLSHDHMFRFHYSKCHTDLNSLVRRNPEDRLWIILTINICLKLVQLNFGFVYEMIKIVFKGEQAVAVKKKKLSMNCFVF